MSSLLPTIRDNLTLTLTSTLTVYVLGYAVYQLYFSPLCHVPGPWYAAISEIWLFTHVLRMRQSRAVQSVFDVYGPIVRVAPNRVAYVDVVSNKRIYSNPKFPKGIFYKGMLANDNEQASVSRAFSY